MSDSGTGENDHLASVTAPSAPSSARSVAACVLLRVWQDDAYAAAALSEEMDRARLAATDRGLCTELVYGVLRVAPFLRRTLQSWGRIKASDHVLRAHLCIAVYQLLFLDRVPAHAAVDEAVSMITAQRGPRVGGFANAVLRNIVRTPPTTSLKEAVLASTPSWLRKRLTRDVGEEAALGLLLPRVTPRPVLRWFDERSSPQWRREQCRPLTEIPGAEEFCGGGDPRRHPEFQRGAFSLQEAGSQCVALATGARAGLRVLDVCAGRGHKSLLLARAVGAEVTATDLHDHKLRALQDEAQRLGASVATEQHDWTTSALPSWQGAFDCVLVDAPCSGVGTLRRRPEITRRLHPDDPGRLAKLQFELVRRASACLAPGGVLTFATCSVLREEAEHVCERVEVELGLSPHCPGTSVDQLLGRAAREGTAWNESDGHQTVKNTAWPAPSALRLLPTVHGTDGYFVARFAMRSG